MRVGSVILDLLASGRFDPIFFLSAKPGVTAINLQSAMEPSLAAA